MTDYRVDLHLHSCLSPCGDDEMTPANIAGMAVVNGLQIVALTDHNTAKNCPAFFKCAKAYGIVPVPGMELTTGEDIHVVCLFRTLEAAMDFDALVEKHRSLVPNEPEIFGHQYIMDEEDRVIGEEPNLLINATDLYLEDAFALVRERDGVCYPAHIDRSANGIVATLGVFPEDPPFTAYELNDKASEAEYLERFPLLKGLRHTVSSDAHYLWNIAEEGYVIPIDDEPYSSALVRNKLIDFLLGRN